MSSPSTHNLACGALLENGSPIASRTTVGQTQSWVGSVTGGSSHLARLGETIERDRRNETCIDVDQHRAYNAIIEWLADRDRVSSAFTSNPEDEPVKNPLSSQCLHTPDSSIQTRVTVAGALVKKFEAEDLTSTSTTSKSQGSLPSVEDNVTPVENMLIGRLQRTKRRASAPAMLEEQQTRKNDYLHLDEGELMLWKRVSAPPDSESLNVFRTARPNTAGRLQIPNYERPSFTSPSARVLITNSPFGSSCPFGLAPPANYAVSQTSVILRSPSQEQRSATSIEPCSICLEPYYQTVPAPDPYNFYVCEHWPGTLPCGHTFGEDCIGGWLWKESRGKRKGRAKALIAFLRSFLPSILFTIEKKPKQLCPICREMGPSSKPIYSKNIDQAEKDMTDITAIDSRST